MKTPNTRKGQSIIEAMIAIGILTMGFLGITALLSKSIFLSRVTSDQVTATYLAEEGIELAKNLLDHGTITGASFGACFFGGADYQFDYSQTNCPPPLYPNPNGTPISYNAVTHLYGYGSGTKTNFTRRIRVQFLGANQISVQAIVSWSTGPVTSQNLTLEDHFYNWRP